ncbi:hypothetical protein [Noviherbaspirillum agri]
MLPLVMRPLCRAPMTLDEGQDEVFDEVANDVADDVSGLGGVGSAGHSV